MNRPELVRPLPMGAAPGGAGVGRMAEVPFTVVAGPRGSYVAERLAAAVHGWGRWPACAWLRVRDRREEPLDGQVAAAVAHRFPAEPVQPDGAPLSGAPDGSVIVVEFTGPTSAADGTLLAALRSAAADRGISVVAVIEHRGSGVLRWADLRIGAAHLAGRDAPAALPPATLRRLTLLAGRRAAVLHDVRSAAEVWPSEVVVEAIARSWRGQRLLDHLTTGLLRLCSPAQRTALEACLVSGYLHPGLTTDTVNAAALRPWLVPLETGWGWLRPVWAGSLAHGLTAVPGTARPPPTGAVAVVAGPPVDPPHSPQPAPVVLQAQLFGDLEVRVDGRAVTGWNGPRGRSLLRFVLYRPRHACPRDELLEEFWPGVGPAAARNRLQVAMSGIRRALGEISGAPIIDYADGGYRIRPGIRVETDFSAFESEGAAGRAAERAGDTAEAVARYSAAIELYRGDFAADVPYEQWTLLPRETLRIAYIDLLDRCSRIHLEGNRFEHCIPLAHRMLDADPCREDAHRLLMRCHARRGRFYQAMRQYEFCCRVLRATLDADPDPRTVELHAQIRRRATEPLAAPGWMRT